MGRSSPGYFAETASSFNPSLSPTKRLPADIGGSGDPVDSDVIQAQREFLKVARSRYREQKMERFGRSAVKTLRQYSHTAAKNLDLLREWHESQNS